VLLFDLCLFFFCFCVGQSAGYEAIKDWQLYKKGMFMYIVGVYVVATKRNIGFSFLFFLVVVGTAVSLHIKRMSLLSLSLSL